MLTAFTTALSALNANSTAVSVVGNNLANLNTPGFKANQVYFRDLVSSGSGGAQGTQVFGTAPPTAIPEFTQGAVQASSGPLDAAIQGDGFFVVTSPSGATMYTRAGNFQINAAGKLTTPTGELVQGWSVDPATGRINANGPVGNIDVPVGTLKPPVATTGFALNLNLNSSAAPNATDLSYPIQVYDDQGNEHTLTIGFARTGANQWSYSISIPAADVAGSGSGGGSGSAPVVASGQLVFNPNGTMQSPDASTPIEFTISDLTSQADPLDLTWNLYSGAGGSTITQYAEASTVSGSTQNGSGPAQLTHVSLGNGGTIIATYSDDQKQVVGQLAIASIRNPDSLTHQGNNNYTVSADTAVPVIGVPGTGGRGNIVGGSIESSTVDIATEFTNLIVYQNAYQANSRMVTSADEICQSTISLIH
jgi:flagellar hook protein FlgE